MDQFRVGTQGSFKICDLITLCKSDFNAKFWQFLRVLNLYLIRNQEINECVYGELSQKSRSIGYLILYYHHNRFSATYQLNSTE